MGSKCNENQTDLSQTICCLLEQYCRQIKETYHRHSVNYQNSIVDTSNRQIIDTVLVFRTVQQTKKNIHIIDTVLAIRTVYYTNQADLSKTLCKLLERYCRHIKQTYHRYCANYQNGIADTSNKLIIDTVLTIRTVQQKKQTDLAETLC